MMVRNFSELTNAQVGKSALVIGSAPTLKLAESHLPDVGFFVGDSMLRTALRPPTRFYVRANTEYPNLKRKSHLKDLQNLDAILVMAETVMESSVSVRELLEKAEISSKISYVFDQRHFGGLPCPVRAACCNVLDYTGKADLTLQETLARYADSNHVYSGGATVSLHAFALAIIMGCTEIHLSGIEIPKLAFEYKYAPIQKNLIWKIRRNLEDNARRAIEVLFSIGVSRFLSTLMRKASAILAPDDARATPSVFSPDFDRIIEDFGIILSLATSLGVSVYVCSHTSHLLAIAGVKKCHLI